MVNHRSPFHILFHHHQLPFHDSSRSLIEVILIAFLPSSWVPPYSLPFTSVSAKQMLPIDQHCFSCISTPKFSFHYSCSICFQIRIVHLLMSHDCTNETSHSSSTLPTVHIISSPYSSSISSLNDYLSEFSFNNSFIVITLTLSYTCISYLVLLQPIFHKHNLQQKKRNNGMHLCGSYVLLLQHVNMLYLPTFHSYLKTNYMYKYVLKVTFTVRNMVQLGNDKQYIMVYRHVDSVRKF